MLISLKNEQNIHFMQPVSSTSETISDSAECYAGLSVRFESSAACM